MAVCDWVTRDVPVPWMAMTFVEVVAAVAATAAAWVLGVSRRSRPSTPGRVVRDRFADMRGDLHIENHAGLSSDPRRVIAQRNTPGEARSLPWNVVARGSGVVRGAIPDEVYTVSRAVAAVPSLSDAGLARLCRPTGEVGMIDRLESDVPLAQDSSAEFPSRSSRSVASAFVTCRPG